MSTLNQPNLSLPGLRGGRYARVPAKAKPLAVATASTAGGGHAAGD